MAEYLMGVDIGSSSCKTSVLDTDGSLIVTVKTDYNIYETADGKSEQNPDDYYRAFVNNVKQIKAFDDKIVGNIKGVAVCGQTPTDIYVDKKGVPLRNAIMWKDIRAKKQQEEIKEKFSIKDQETFCGCVIPDSPNWTTPRMIWVSENEKNVAENTYKILQAKDYLIFKLSGKFTTDPWSARCFANIHTKKPYTDLIGFLGYKDEIVPEIFDIFEVCAKTDKNIFAETGIKEGTSIVCGCGDGFASMVSSGVFEKQGYAFNSAGTSEISGISFDQEKTVSGMYTFSKTLTKEKTVIFGPTQSGGNSLNWLAKNVFNMSFTDIIEYAGFSKAGANGLVFLPYLQGERAPIWNPDAKGIFFGLTDKHTMSDFSRAVLEGVAFSVKNCLETASEVPPEKMRIMGGGSKVDLWNRIRADVIGTEVEVIDCEEAVSQGSAMIAGIGAGVWGGLEEATKKVLKIKESYSPDLENKNAYDRNYNLFRELYIRTKDLMEL